MDGSQYQRAVTPSLDKNGYNHSSNGLVRGKVLTYQNRSRSSRGMYVSENGSVSSAGGGGGGGGGGSSSSGGGGAGPKTGMLPTQNKYTMHVGQSQNQSQNQVQGRPPRSMMPTSIGIFHTDMNVQGRSASNSQGGSAKSENTQVDSASIFTLPRYDLVPLSDEIPADGIIFARVRNNPDSLVVFRTNEERARNPERLNLDRRQLDFCPLLEQEQRLRLLNFQNNNIRSIQNLENLPNLIFLDLYNNKLTSLEGSVSSVRGLRVLMAGKNRITAITNLTMLRKLDVLDIHSNDIRVIENLEGLTDLRVLNLAGNRISTVQNVSSLQSLTELNLRRNVIEKVAELDKIPCLQRIFLSHNMIVSMSDIQCLFSVRMLIELSLDGNPVADVDPLAYRCRLLAGITGLRHLDLKRVSDDEREAAIEACAVMPAAGEGQLANYVLQPPAMQGGDGQNSECVLAGEGGSSSTYNSNGNSNSGSGSGSGGTVTFADNSSEAQSHAAGASASAGSIAAGRNGSAPPVSKSSNSSTHQSQSESLVALVKAGKILSNQTLFDIEITAPNEKALIVAGENWEWLQPKRIYSNVTEVSLLHVKLEVIRAKVAPNMSWLPALKMVRLVNNEICTLKEVEEMCGLFGAQLEEMIIKDNPVCSLGPMVRHYLIAKQPKLRVLNGFEVSAMERSCSNVMMEPLLAAHNVCLAESQKSQMSKRSEAGGGGRRGAGGSSLLTVSRANTVSHNLGSGGSTGHHLSFPSDEQAVSDSFSELTSLSLHKSKIAVDFDKTVDDAVKMIMKKTMQALISSKY